jgi:hypothetical protein
MWTYWKNVRQEQILNNTTQGKNMLVELYKNWLPSGDFNRDVIDHWALFWELVWMMMKGIYKQTNRQTNHFPAWCIIQSVQTVTCKYVKNKNRWFFYDAVDEEQGIISLVLHSVYSQTGRGLSVYSHVHCTWEWMICVPLGAPPAGSLLLAAAAAVVPVNNNNSMINGLMWVWTSLHASSRSQHMQISLKSMKSATN